ncbi:tyrosine-type recombinase/integrase [Microbacterium xylanilyticum]
MHGTWIDAISEYTLALRTGDYPVSTIKLRAYHLRRLAQSVGVGVSEVTTDHVQAFLDQPGWAPSYRRTYRVTFRHFFRWARSAGVTHAKPMKGIMSSSAPLGKPRPAPESAVLEGQRYHDTRVRTMVRLGAHVGLRCCEICRVHRNDVIETAHGYKLRVLGKGRKVRVLPLPRALAHEILAADGWLFPGQIDGHLSAAYVSKLVSRALPDGWTAHPLRHRFASRAYVGTGKDIRAVQELLGHASVATTQIYTEVEDDALRAGVEFAAA